MGFCGTNLADWYQVNFVELSVVESKEIAIVAVVAHVLIFPVTL